MCHSNRAGWMMLDACIVVNDYSPLKMIAEAAPITPKKGP